MGLCSVSWDVGWCWISAVFSELGCWVVLDQCCVPGMLVVLDQCCVQSAGMLDASDPFQMPQNLCEFCSAVIASIMSLRCQQAAAQLTRAMALEPLFPPHTITSSSDCSLCGFSTCSMIQLCCSVFKLPLMIQPLAICSASQCCHNDSKSSCL